MTERKEISDAATLASGVLLTFSIGEVTGWRRAKSTDNVYRNNTYVDPLI